ncbi:uncharacterized protein LAESUDRAFT_721690 [Laetiporus sulphureus 93-53]|uniref:TIP120-domain-containing protein n=1 Tax=Laetiporus sulphureus 93-53 TaxID=1314785 RepID=A0A165GHG6_9APHY|nr:uncharacterized protein LAESUDRAFT_721690 [Laetiporus sulphureus 93-53]KZT10353.1 hypothetical protein LAESUDRAFT_721690 [Laetiporus sulphureus 93-53]
MRAQDPSIAVTANVMSAVHDERPKKSLTQIARAIEHLGSTEVLEPLTLVALLLPSSRDGAEQLLNLMAQQCSAKEVVMATKEALEHLALSLDGDDETEAVPDTNSGATQLERGLRLYIRSVPRLPKRKKSASEVLQPLVSELEALNMRIGGTASAEESRALISSASELATSIYASVESDTTVDIKLLSEVKAILYSFLSSVIEAFIDAVKEDLATKAFAAHFPRLIVPQSEETSSSEQVGVISTVQAAVTALGFRISDYESRLSLGSLVLLAHSPSYSFSVPMLTSFFPIILISLQSNTALDEVLSLLINSIVPLQSQSPSELPPDLIVPLAHVLPPLASVHPEPSTRHQTFRLLSVVLSLAPSPLRLQLLYGLLTDPDSLPQMRVAAVGLVKEAVLEGLSTTMGSSDAARNVFASPIFLQTLGSTILQTDPPELFTSGEQLSLAEFLESAEPLRLVECLALYYVLLLRDVQNRTGVRDKDNLSNVERTLLRPLRQQFEAWNHDGDSSHTGDSEMQLAILDMWLDRVSDAVKSIYAV